MPLDLEPVLDLQEGQALDLQPAQPAKLDLQELPEGPTIGAAPEIGTFQKVKQSIRESLAPLLGPTEEQASREGVTTTGPDGQLQRVYKPAGDAIERLGLIGGLSQPAKAIPRATYSPDDPMYKALLKAGYNVGAGFGEFAESPLGLATMALGGAAGIPASAFKEATTAEEAIAAAKQLKTVHDLQRAVGGAFALDMASKVPETARAAGELSTQPGLGPKIEAGLQLATAVGLPASLAVHARPTSTLEHAANLLDLGIAEGPRAPTLVPSQPQAISEFGGIADRPGVVRTSAGEVSPISTPEGLTLEEPETPKPEQQEGEENAIGLQRDEEGVQSQRVSGDERGQATEAVSSDSLRGGAEGEQAATGTLEPLPEPQTGAEAGTPPVVPAGPEAVQASGPAPSVAAPMVQGDFFERLLNRAIAATDYNPQNVHEGVSGAPVWITKAAANGALRAVRVAYRATKDIARALKAGVASLRALPAFNANEAFSWLDSASGASQREDLPMRVGTRNPTAEAATEDAVQHQTVIDMKSFMRNPEAVAQADALIKRYYPQVRPGDTPAKTISNFIDHVAKNLVWLHDQYAPHLAAGAKLWYDGARNLAVHWSHVYEVPRQAVAGVIALLSPQRDWFQNVELARRVLTIVKDPPGGGKWTPEMDKLVGDWIRITKEDTDDALSDKTRAALKDNLKALQTVRFNKLDRWQQAVWLRAYSEAHMDAGYNVWAPEGHELGPARNANGSRASISWPGFASIGKAIDAIYNPDLRNISDHLGVQHKIRNFYNNILNPNDPRFGDVTIDTHAVAAGLLQPVGGEARVVLHNFGNKPKGEPGPVGDSVNGLSGLYALYADAYRRAAAERGLLPREMQSITWEAGRGLFKPEFKTDENLSLVNRIWQEYRNGERTLNGARKEILKAAGGIDAPDWARPSRREAPEVGSAGEPGELPGLQRQPQPGAGGSGNVSAGDTGGVLQERGVGGAWQSALDTLDSLKVDTRGGTLHAFGLVPEAWNTLIELAKLGVRSGKGVADAVDWALQKFKENGFAFGQAFDEKAAREHLVGELGERATGVKIQEAGAVSSQTKDAVMEYLYQVRHNASDQETADGIVQSAGVDAAERALVNPPANMPGAVQSKLLGSVTRALAQSERQARASGDTFAANQLAERQGKLWDTMLPRITEMAQSLQALRDIIDMTPEGHVARVRAGLERKANDLINGERKPEVEVMRGALEEGQRAGVEAVRQDPEVNGAARAAVNEAVQNSSETHRAVIMDLAEEWSQSPVIVNQARELVRERANDILKERPPAVGQVASDALRQTMDDLGKRAATIASAYFQGMASHANGLAGLYRERLGLSEVQSKRLAERMDQEFKRQVTIAKNKLPQRIANARVTRDRNNGILDPNAPASAVERAIRRQLQNLNLKLGDVIRSESQRQEGVGSHVAERIVEASGLTGEKADTLRNVLKQRWDAIVTKAQVSALEARQAATGVKVRGKMKDAWQKLQELHNLGALTGDRFYDVVKKALKLRELTEADAKRLKDLVVDAQRQPEGFLRERAAAEVLKETEKLSGERHWYDVPMAIWYTNAVSGFTTWAKIPFENTNMYVANILAALTSRPGEALNPGRFLVDTAGALKRGLGKGGLQAESTLRTGTVTGVWNKPKTNILEGALGPKWDKVNFWKYLARITSTAHELTFKPAWEFKQAMLARDVARREGLAGKALTQRVADLMGNTDEAVARARGQATQELTDLGRLTGRRPGESPVAFAKRATADKLDLARRTREIIEQARETKMPGSTEVARDYALRTTYLNEPYGVMGILADGINAALRKVRLEAPVTGIALKTQVPFVRVASNILNEAWNWGPGGLQRAALSHWTGKLYGRPIMDPRERAEMYAKGILGTAAVATLATLYGDKIHGMGPGDPKRRKQLLAQGWIPYSIGPINGRYYSLDKTPLKLWAAVLGNYEDWRRYGKGEDADGATRFAFVTKASISTLLNQSMLESVKNALEALGDTNTGGGAHKLEQATARAGSTFVLPNLVQQLDRVWDPTVYDQQGAQALVTSQVPFVRRENRPVLNILGEPIQSSPFHYWTSQVSQDPVWRFLAEKGAFVPEPSKASIVGSKKLGEGQYRAITPDEYYDLVAKTGPQIRQAILQSMPQMKDLNREQTQDIVAMIANRFHTAYKATLTP